VILEGRRMPIFLMIFVKDVLLEEKVILLFVGSNFHCALSPPRIMMTYHISGDASGCVEAGLHCCARPSLFGVLAFTLFKHPQDL
jgi:hypothetical protein